MSPTISDASSPDAAPASGEGTPAPGRSLQGLTPEQVRQVRFDPPQPGRRGYREDEVDAFLGLVEATFRGQADLVSAEVRQVAFSAPARFDRGYDEDQVDSFLDEVERELDRRAAARAASEGALRLATGADLRAVRLPRAGSGERAYPASQVDALLERGAAALDGSGELPAAEVTSAGFGPVSALPGYRADAVDELLDALHRELRDRGR